MYLIDRAEELTPTRLGKIIQSFELKEKIQLMRYHNYYIGKQPIMSKVATDVGKPNNRIMTNYCNDIVNIYKGYLTGIDISYQSENDFEDIQQVLNYNDVSDEDNTLLQNALIYGVAYEINYVDLDGKQRFKVLDSRECIPIYSADIQNDLLYVVRYYVCDKLENNSPDYYVEVYDSNSMKRYKSTMGFSSFNLLEEEPHYFEQVPITVFNLNDESISIFDQIMTLQDAYNEMLSCEADDFEAFADAYLILKGAYLTDDSMTDAEKLEAVRGMRERRILEMDVDASAEYLTKSISDTQIENMLNRLNDSIHNISKAPDFNDEKFLAQSGIAMRYKLTGFENVSSNIEKRMTKALQKRIELICAILNLTSGEQVWRDVEIIFTRNLPVNELETAQIINQLRGLVSDETLIAQLSFIKDPAHELELIKAQKLENMETYNFGNISDEETEEDVEE